MKRGERTYVYEETSYWDSSKKQGRKQLTYIGKVDAESGEVIAPKKRLESKPVSSRSYGGCELLRKVSQMLGLDSILKELYPNDYEDILALVYFKLLSGEPFYLITDWLEENELQCEVNSSQAISKLFASLGHADGRIEQFFSLWRKQFNDIEAVFFDITSISTYSENIEIAERGYNRDGDNLKQINLGLIASKTNGLPLAYRIYPGSINDVSTLHNAIELFSQLQLDASLFIMDRGFYSDRNICDCVQEDIKILIPLPSRTKSFQSLLKRNQELLKSVQSSFCYKHKTTFFYSKDSLTIGKKKFDAHIYLDPVHKAEEMSRLLMKIDNFEGSFAQKSFKNKEEVETYIKQSLGSLVYFLLYEDSDHFEIKRNEEEIENKINQMGVFILVTNQSLDQTQILDYYRGKDDVEKIFNDLKHPLNEDRIRCNNQSTMHGKLFVLFIGLILYSHIKQTAKTQGLFKKFTIPQLFKELQKLKTFHLSDGKKILAEISKKQKEIFSAFGIECSSFKT